MINILQWLEKVPNENITCNMRFNSNTEITCINSTTSITQTASTTTGYDLCVSSVALTLKCRDLFSPLSNQQRLGGKNPKTVGTCTLYGFIKSLS